MQHEKTISSKKLIPLKPYSLTGLAALYGVNWRTIKAWIKPYEAEIGTKQGRIYKIPQVKIIFSKLGLPSTIDPDTEK